MSTGPRAGVPIVDLDPYDYDVLREPEEFHEQLREAGPIVWLSRYEAYACGRHDQVVSGLVQNHDLISSAGVGLPDLRDKTKWRPRALLIEADQPEHTPRRAVLNKLLSPRALRKMWEPIEALADKLVDELLDRGTFDAVGDLAERYPLMAFPELIGLADDVRPHLLSYGDLVFNMGGPENELLAIAQSRSVDAMVAVMAQTRRAALRPDGIGSQIWNSVDSGELTADEAPQLVRSLLSAGVDTTVAAIAAAIVGLATHPDQWELLKAEPDRVRLAFEEAIRWESPAQIFYRTAVRDVDLGEATVPADAKVALCLGAANRDPRRFDAPNRYDITRRVAGHVGFGYGIHQCVGQHLGRLEGHAVLSALARKVDTLELAGKPVRRLNNTLRSWGEVPVAVSRAR